MKVGRSRMKISRSVDTNEREEEDKSGSLLKSVEINVEECDSRGAKEEGCTFRSKVDAVRGYRIKREAEGKRRKENARGNFDARKQRGDPDGAFG